MKKIETIDLIIYGGITILAIFLLIFLGVDSSPIDNLHTSPGLPTNYPSLPIHSDPILGNWILPNNETRHLEDITFEQAKLITEIIERLATVEHKSDLPIFRGFVGELWLPIKGKPALKDFGESDLILLEQTGYIVFSQRRKYDPCRTSEPLFKIGLTPKAYQQFDLYKTPDANYTITSISHEISRLLTLLKSY